MGRTPIRAKDSPGFIANRLARPFSAGVAADARRRVADVGDDRPRLPPRRRLPDGPVRADRPDRPRRQPQRRPLLLRPGRRAGALAPEPDPGAAGRRRPPRPQVRRAASTTTARTGPANPASAVTLMPVIYRGKAQRNGRGPTLDPGALAEIDPAAPEILPRLVAQIANEAAFALEEEVGSPADMDTAMRLGFNWPLGPLEFADLIGPGRRRRPAGRPPIPARRCLRSRPPPPLRRRAQPCPSRCRLSPKAASRPPISQRGATARWSRPSPSPTKRTSRKRGAGWSPPSSRRWSRTTTGGSSGSWAPTTSSRTTARTPSTPASGARAASTGIAGLFELAPGVYQLRGFDLSNMHVVEGDEGIVVIDPLVSAETRGRRARALPRAPRRAPGHRRSSTPTATSTTSAAPGASSPRRRSRTAAIPVIAPAGFLHHAVSENVFAGTAMGAPRRLHVRGAARPRARRAGRRRPRADDLARHDHADPAQPRHRRDRPGGGRRRGPDGLPAHPGHRGAGGDEHPLPRAPGALHRRQRRPLDAQHPHPARRPGPRPARSGRTTSTRRSSCSAPTPTCSSPGTTGRAGAASGSSTSSRSSATSTPTCTTRPCGC